MTLMASLPSSLWLRWMLPKVNSYAPYYCNKKGSNVVQYRVYSKVLLTKRTKEEREEGKFNSPVWRRPADKQAPRSA